jgi:hypothetical protein
MLPRALRRLPDTGHRSLYQGTMWQVAFDLRSVRPSPGIDWRPRVPWGAPSARLSNIQTKPTLVVPKGSVCAWGPLIWTQANSLKNRLRQPLAPRHSLSFGAISIAPNPVYKSVIQRGTSCELTHGFANGEACFRALSRRTIQKACR